MTEQVECPKCGRIVVVTRGRLRAHGVERGQPVPLCPLSGVPVRDIPAPLTEGELDAMTRVMGGGL